MLQKHPENRISAAEALEHKWFQMYKEKDKQLQVMQNPALTGAVEDETKNIKIDFDEKDKTNAVDLKDMTYT